MPIAKYELYRVRMPRIKNPQGNLFGGKESDEEIRNGFHREAVQIGQQSEAPWIAGNPNWTPDSLALKIGVREEVQSHNIEKGDFIPTTTPVIKVTDVFINLPTGLMLIRKDNKAPSPHMIGAAYKLWLKQAVAGADDAFDVIVEPVPQMEEFLVALREAETITRLSFVVRGPNPADEDAIIESLALFTQEHEIQSTNVVLNSPSLDQTFATRVAAAVIKLGGPVSAMIKDKSSSIMRTIRVKKKPRVLHGPVEPTPEEGRQLLEDLRASWENPDVGQKGDDDKAT